MLYRHLATLVARPVAMVVACLVASAGLVVLHAPAADAADCLRTVKRVGGSGIAWNDDANETKVARSAAKVTICVKYAKAYGGYYIAGAKCDATWARLNTWNVSRVKKVTDGRYNLGYVYCESLSGFGWDRTWPAHDEYSCDVISHARWEINQINGTITREGKTTQDDWFRPLFGCDGGRSLTDKPDTESPVLGKPAASLSNPTSRTAQFSISATDDRDVSTMRVMATGDEAWRPWVPYTTSGTVILPDRYGDFNIWFQVRDAAGNVSSKRASNIITRVKDTGVPTITGASLSKGDETSRYVQYSLSAADDYNGVAQMRVLVSGEDWRPWVAYNPSGTVVLPDGWGRFGVTFQVMDGVGNVSATRFAGAVTRTAAVTPVLRQIDNNGIVRSCGATPPGCSDVVKKFRTTISSAVLPDTNLLLKAWRYVNGSWTETSTSPFMWEPINGRWTIDMTVTANLLPGTWRFQAQIPRDPEDVTAFGASEYQYLLID